MTQVTAIAKNVRISPQKVRLVVDQIRKIKPQQSMLILEHVPQKASGPLKKVIASAIANAQNNYGLDTGSLTFAEINVNKGQVFKRYRAISRGRAHSILKQTSNIKVILEGEQASKVAKVTEEPKEPKVATTEKNDSMTAMVAGEGKNDK